MKRKITWVGLLVALAVTLAVACGDSDEDAPAAQPAAGAVSTAAPAATAQAAAPAEPKDLIVGIPGDSTNVQGDRANVGQFSPNANIYETLGKIDNSYAVTPWLAERWEFVEPNTWRFTLRQGVTFHDGSPLTAADVVYTFDRLARTGGGPINAKVGGTVAVDERTVEYTPTVVNKKIPLQLVGSMYGIMKAGSDPVNKPVGTGPYKFVEYRPKESFRVERYAEYWDKPNAAKTKSITFKYIPDPNARVLALRAGDIDIAEALPRESVQQLKNDRALKLVTSPVSGTQALYVNANGAGGFDQATDKVVRQAVAKAIDRETIVKEVYEGNAEVARTHLPAAILGPSASRIQGQKYDLEGAKKLLDDAGWRAGGDGIRAKDGKRLELTLINGQPTPGQHKPVPEVLQAQLRKIGIDLKIVESTSANDVLVEGKGNLWMWAFSQLVGDPASLPRSFRSATGGNAFPEQAAAWGTARIDPIVAQVQASADIPRSQELVAQVMSILIDEEAVIIPIASTGSLFGTRESISGLEAHVIPSVQPYNAVVKR